MIPYIALTDSVLPWLLFFSMILPSHAASSNIFDTPGSVALFLDEGCEKPTTNPTTAELALSTCLVTHGALGISVEHLPHCPSGSYMLQLFQDTTCSNGVNLNQSNGLCFSNGPSGIPAIAWECAGADEAFAATATSTVEAGTVVSAATSGAGRTTSTTVSAPSTTNGKSGAITATATKSALTSSATGNPSPTGTSSANGSQTGSSDSGGSGAGLSRTDQIVIGVVLPAGAIVVALLAWLWPKPFRKSKQNQTDKAPAARGQPLAEIRYP